jgi:hypothetical protein
MIGPALGLIDSDRASSMPMNLTVAFEARRLSAEREEQLKARFGGLAGPTAECTSDN